MCPAYFEIRLENRSSWLGSMVNSAYSSLSLEILFQLFLITTINGHNQSALRRLWDDANV
jgi:hypothetical protein